MKETIVHQQKGPTGKVSDTMKTSPDTIYKNAWTLQMMKNTIIYDGKTHKHADGYLNTGSNYTITSMSVLLNYT